LRDREGNLALTGGHLIVTVLFIGLLHLVREVNFEIAAEIIKFETQGLVELPDVQLDRLRHEASQVVLVQVMRHKYGVTQGSLLRVRSLERLSELDKQISNEVVVFVDHFLNLFHFPTALELGTLGIGRDWSVLLHLPERLLHVVGLGRVEDSLDLLSGKLAVLHRLLTLGELATLTFSALRLGALRLMLLLGLTAAR